MSALSDDLIWTAVERRLGGVERFIPATPTWRGAGEPSETSSIRVVAGRALGGPRTKHRRAVRRRVWVLVALAAALAIVGAALVVGARLQRLVADVRPTGSMVVPRLRQSATLLADGRVLLIGGDASGTSAELYDPSTGKFKATGSWIGNTSTPYPVAVRLGDGRVLVVSGGGTTAELYDPTSGTFGLTGSMSVGRTRPSATLLQDGRVLVIGGGTNSGGPGSVGLASAELYDPATGQFSATGSTLTAREGPTATLLPDGRVLVIGTASINGSGDGSWAEMYDPRIGHFTVTGAPIVRRGMPTAVALRDGRVLITGGSIGAETSSAEIFDPSSGAFASAGSMSYASIVPNATLLPDGHVLMSGAGNTGPVPIERFDPQTGIFSETATHATAPMWSSATLLVDGDVLIAGGITDMTTGVRGIDAFLIDGGVIARSPVP